METVDRADNVYLIDTKMFNFNRYCAAYLVVGKEIALIDTGLPNQLETVRAGIQAHGFSISDISHIFITHAHTDHCGEAKNNSFAQDARAVWRHGACPALPHPIFK